MIYIFCGNDYETIKTKYDLLLEAQNLRSVTFESVKDMCAYIYNKPLISQNMAYCARYDNDFFSAEVAWQSILDTAKANTIILIYGELDKRSKFYKFFSDFIIDFREEETNYAFAFVDEFCLGNFKKALEVAEHIDAKDSIGVLSMLYNKLRKIIQIKATPKGVKISANTGLKDNEVYFNRKFLEVYSTDTLQYLMSLVVKLCENIKLGRIDAEIAIPWLIIYLLDNT